MMKTSYNRFKIIVVHLFCITTITLYMTSIFAKEPKKDLPTQKKVTQSKSVKKVPVKVRPLELQKSRLSTQQRTKTRKKKIWPTKRPQRALVKPPKLGRIPFELGERLVYKVNMMNAHAGTVTLQVGHRGTFEGKKVLSLSGHIQSSPFLENFYPIRDSQVVLVDEKNFLPLKSDFDLNEKGKSIRYLTFFNQKTAKIDWRKTKKINGVEKRYKEVYQGPKGMFETLSSVYAMRRLDIKKGLMFEQYIWDGQRERFVTLTVVGEDRVLTDLGWIDAMKVSISSVITGGIIKRNQLKRPPVKGTAWFAKDPYRTPIKLITPTRLGIAEATLVQKTIEPLQNP